MLQNLRIKILCQNWAYNLTFIFILFFLFYVKSFYCFLYIKIFKDHKKFNWRLNYFYSQKNDALNFKYMKYSPFFLYIFSTKCKEPIYYLVKICHFWNLQAISFHMTTFVPTWLYLEKILPSLYIGKWVVYLI